MRGIGPLLITFSVVIAFTAAIAAIYFKGPDGVETWAVIAACLSVLVGAIAAYASQQSAELMEREFEPDVSITLIPRLVTGDKNLRLVNLGRASAFEVTVEWQIPQPPEADRRIKSIRQLRQFEDMEYQLPETFRSSEGGYKAIVRWKDANKKPYHAFYETTDEELTFIARAKLEDRRNPQLEGIQRELRQTRSDEKAQQQDAMQQLSQLLRRLRR